MLRAANVVDGMSWISPCVFHFQTPSLPCPTVQVQASCSKACAHTKGLSAFLGTSFPSRTLLLMLPFKPIFDETGTKNRTKNILSGFCGLLAGGFVSHVLFLATSLLFLFPERNSNSRLALGSPPTHACQKPDGAGKKCWAARFFAHFVDTDNLFVAKQSCQGQNLFLGASSFGLWKCSREAPRVTSKPEIRSCTIVSFCPRRRMPKQQTNHCCP